MFPIFSTSMASRVAFGVELTEQAICSSTKKHGFLPAVRGRGNPSAAVRGVGTARAQLTSMPSLACAGSPLSASGVRVPGKAEEKPRPVKQRDK